MALIASSGVALTRARSPPPSPTFTQQVSTTEGTRSVPLEAFATHLLGQVRSWSRHSARAVVDHESVDAVEC